MHASAPRHRARRGRAGERAARGPRHGAHGEGPGAQGGRGVEPPCRDPARSARLLRAVLLGGIRAGIAGPGKLRGSQHLSRCPRPLPPPRRTAGGKHQLGSVGGDRAGGVGRLPPRDRPVQYAGRERDHAGARARGARSGPAERRRAADGPALRHCEPARAVSDGGTDAVLRGGGRQRDARRASLCAAQLAAGVRRATQ